ncbi:uncharacterized protein [Lolium perenne]|uniref:uncharacterized protein n=1 Tax=Lolium perenne TaxID=4522 RepID=UPI0021EA99C2|nr:uncharacterized protein LOC127309710 [Lolium perenne]
MNRPFVNLLAKKWSDGRPAFNLHRIDPARLFSPTRSQEPADPTPIKKAPALARLPPAAVSFDWPCTRYPKGWIHFMALKNDIIAVDHHGDTLLYDGALGAVRVMNPKPNPRCTSISLTVGDSLYTMDVSPGPPPKVKYFDAFTYGPSFGKCLPEDWYWRPLPPPPIDYDHYKYEYDPHQIYDRSPEREPHPCSIGSYTVVRDSQIWISTVGAGTYSFDTATHAWSKVGDWALPFKGHAKYAPEHGLWFGFSESDGQLCVADLAQMSPPVKLNSWEELPLPGGWFPVASHLLPLGSGKFCVVRFFQVIKLWRRPVVLTGVEFHGTAAGPGSLRIIKHKSRRYHFQNYEDVKLV